MATETKTTDYAALVKPSDGLVKVRTGAQAGPNPLAGILARTRTEGPLSIPVANADQAREVTNFLRRDAKETDSGLSIQFKNGRGDKVEMDKARSVHFVAKDKSQRAYTADDIRQWFGYPKARKLTDLERACYRVVHNLDTKADRDVLAAHDINVEEYRAANQSE